MLFHYSVPGFICRKERSSGFDQRKNKGRRRSLFQRPPSIILSSFSSLLHPTLKLKDQETSCVGCIKTEVSGTFSLHCICLSPADAYFMKQFHEKRIAANFQNSKCLMHSFGQFFTFKAQLLQKESQNNLH